MMLLKRSTGQFICVTHIWLCLSLHSSCYPGCVQMHAGLLLYLSGSLSPELTAQLCIALFTFLFFPLTSITTSFNSYNKVFTSSNLKSFFYCEEKHIHSHPRSLTYSLESVNRIRQRIPGVINSWCFALNTCAIFSVNLCMCDWQKGFWFSCQHLSKG